MNIATLGFIAAFLTTFANLPQVIKILKSKKTKALSLPMYIMLSLGFSLWIVYAVILKDVPLIFSNLVTLALVLPIVFLKIKYG